MQTFMRTYGKWMNLLKYAEKSVQRTSCHLFVVVELVIFQLRIGAVRWMNYIAWKVCAICLVVSSLALSMYRTIFFAAEKTKHQFLEPLPTNHQYTAIWLNLLLCVNDFNGRLFCFVHSYFFVIYLLAFFLRFLFGKIYGSIFYFRPIFW